MKKNIKEIIEKHIHFNVMYILFIDDWSLWIVIGSVVQWSVLCLTPWRPWFKSGWCHLLEDSYLYFMRIIKSSITIVLAFIRCLDGALISLEVNTLNSSGSDPCKNIDRDKKTFVFYRPSFYRPIKNTVVFYRPSWNKHKGYTCRFNQMKHEG